MNDSIKELEKRIKNSWPVHDLSEAAQQSILYNIKMHQNSRNKQSKVKRYRVAYGLSLVAVMLVAFILIKPMFDKHQSVGPKPTIQKEPVVNEAHPPKVKKEVKSEYYFPQWFNSNNNTVYINNNIGWAMIKEDHATHSEAVKILFTVNHGDEWKTISRINGDENSSLLGGTKVGITFNNKKHGWISIRNDADPEAPYLLESTDGGKKWRKQLLPIPDQYKDMPRDITKPVFFSSSDGIVPIIEVASSPQESKLLYMIVTHDSGKTWTAVTEQSSGNLSWDFRDPSHGKVIFNKKTWITPDLGGNWHSQ